jgi:hypothetical protein
MAVREDLLYVTCLTFRNIPNEKVASFALLTLIPPYMDLVLLTLYAVVAIATLSCITTILKEFKQILSAY